MKVYLEDVHAFSINGCEYKPDEKGVFDVPGDVVNQIVKSGWPKLTPADEESKKEEEIKKPDELKNTQQEQKQEPAKAQQKKKK